MKKNYACMRCGRKPLQSEITVVRFTFPPDPRQIDKKLRGWVEYGLCRRCQKTVENSIINHPKKPKPKPSDDKCPKCHQGKMWPMIWCDCCGHVEEPDGTGKKVK